MSRVIVERPRRGGHTAVWAALRRKVRQQLRDEKYWDNVDNKQSMLFPYDRNNWERKRLNENLSPLYRYLLAQAGRPWNEVYSEVCERIRLDSPVQKHVLTHLHEMVEKNVVAVRGDRVFALGQFGMGEVGGRGMFDSLYVHPDGTLQFKVVKKYRSPLRFDGAGFIASGSPFVQKDGRLFVKRCGAWFEILTRQPTPEESAAEEFRTDYYWPVPEELLFEPGGFNLSKMVPPLVYRLLDEQDGRTIHVQWLHFMSSRYKKAIGTKSNELTWIVCKTYFYGKLPIGIQQLGKRELKKLGFR